MKGQELSERANELLLYDRLLRISEGGIAIVGLDEAGRGPLAGPVFAAAVCFDEGVSLDCVYDSKRLSERQREFAYKAIVDEAAFFSVASSSSVEIDSLNIRQASLLAMRRAAEMLPPFPSLMIVDGKDALGHNLYSRAIVRGDSLSLSISAASILAKVTRDAYMKQLEEECPGYGFAKHKGYPTAEHLEAIRRLGPSIHHRRSFRGVL